jgi:hypothetical protein
MFLFLLSFLAHQFCLSDIASFVPEMPTDFKSYIVQIIPIYFAWILYSLRFGLFLFT